jgi:hypothetical protein
MKFKDLKEGDNIYVVNKGSDFGIRLETHVVESIEVYDTYKYLNLDDSGGLMVDDACKDLDNIGFFFTNLEKAQKSYLKEEHEVYCSLIGKASKYLRQYNNLVEIMNNISEQRDEIEQDLILNGYTLES